jgi:KaiC/GvpD/RAD55 family RecA-like ATPase
MPTGFAALDRATRGGFRAGGIVMVIGAPGAGKTMMVTQFSVRYARTCHVMILASDENAENIAIRIAQQLGLDRDRVESGAEYAQAVAAVGALDKLHLMDAHVEAATIDDAADELRRLAGDDPAVLIVDSVQTARARGDEFEEGVRARIDAHVAALKRAASSGLLVISTSEAARRNYMSVRSQQEADPLAAGKESGGIEFAANVQIVLTSAKGESDIVDAVVPKNRWGFEKPRTRYKVDFARGTLTEIAAGPTTVGALFGDTLVSDVNSVRKEVIDHPGIGIRDLERALKGKMGKPRVQAALATLRANREIETRRDGQRHCLFVQTTNVPSPNRPAGVPGTVDVPLSPASPALKGGDAGRGTVPGAPPAAASPGQQDLHPQ